MSLDGFIARPDGGIDWLERFESEDHGYVAFFAGVDALVIGLIRGFLREGLVDELTVNVVPLVLGAGRPLFASGLPELPLRLLEAKSFPSGLVQLRYARA